ncbi:unnamed protein product, partial [Owenia fusiformis]
FKYFKILVCFCSPFIFVLDMKLDYYREIVDLIHWYGTRDCIECISKVFTGVPKKTLGSIFSQDYQRQMKKIHYKMHQAHTVRKLYNRYLDSLSDKGNKNILLHIADEIGLAPALLARMILERHLSINQYDGESAPRLVLTQFMKQPDMIDDITLAREIQSCVLSDDQYGPITDSIKHSIGWEYEFMLKKRVEEMEIPYLDEDQMRLKGYDKTPDVKLEVPIAYDGHVVNWVESKASFGDEESHKGYLKDQFWSYWNRFGPGMVIYWFGFIDELDCNRNKGIILMDHFPIEDFVKMDP